MIRTLLDRRVPQYLGLYVAAGWGFVQFVDWAVEQYALAETWTNLTATLLVLALPTVALLAWRFGAPGDDRWRATDAGAIGLNVLLAAAIAFGLFRDADFGTASDLRLVEDAEGNTVERVVPPASERKRVMTFPAENRTGDPELDWLESGLEMAIAADGGQDPFISGLSASAEEPREQLAGEGFGPGDPVPLPLMRRLARSRGMDYFVRATIDRGAADSLVADVVLHDAETGRQISERRYAFVHPLVVADEITVDLRRDMGISEARIEGSVDLPAADLVTHSPEAFRRMVEALEASEAGDLAGAGALAEDAIALDSTFAWAHVQRALTAFETGDRAAMDAAMAEVDRYDYRLPERVRLGFQAFRHSLRGDYEGAMRTVRYWTELYPNDAGAWVQLAALHSSLGDTPASVRDLRRALAVDSMHYAARRSLAGVLAREGEADSAAAHYAFLTRHQPGNAENYTELGNSLWTAHRFEEAREAYAQAAVVAPRDPAPATRLGFMELAVGDLAAAARQLEQVRDRATTPRERERKAGLEESIYYQRGQFGRVEAAYRERLRLLDSIESPIGLLGNIQGSEFLQYGDRVGREADVYAQVDSLRASVGDPDGFLVSWPAARVAGEIGDLDRLREGLGGMRALAGAGYSMAWAAPRIAYIEGKIAEWEDGGCRRAIRIYEDAIDAYPRFSVLRAGRLECLIELERWADAEGEVEWFMEDQPGRPMTRLTIARLHAGRGAPDLALEHLDYALEAWSEADPDFRPAREAAALRDSLRTALGGS